MYPDNYEAVKMVNKANYEINIVFVLSKEI